MQLFALTGIRMERTILLVKDRENAWRKLSVETQICREWNVV